jgi:hypothetical protein
MMLERRQQEIELIRREFGDLTVGTNLEWVVINQYPLVPGWNKTETPVLLMIPPGYPATPPDNFYVDPDLRIGQDNTMANATSIATMLDKQWVQFSYHVEASEWKAHPDLLLGHNLLTFIHAVKQRLSEVN